MALPTNLASKIKSVPMDPTVMASELELGYLLSFSQNSTYESIQTSLMIPSILIQDRSIKVHSKTINSPISRNKPTNNFSRKLRSPPPPNASN